MLRWSKPKKDEMEAPAAPTQPAAVAPPRPVAAVPAGPAPAAPAPAVPAAPPANPSLSQVLMESGKITPEQMKKALAIQRETGAFLGEILVEEGLIDENSLLNFLAKACKIPHLSLLDYLIDQEILKLIPQEICLKYRLLPIDKLGRNLTVAMVNPLNQQALQAMQQVCPDLRIKPILCAHKHFEQVTARLFSDGNKRDTKSDLTATSLGLIIPKPAPAPEPEPEAPVAEALPEAKPTGESHFDDVFDTSLGPVDHSKANPTVPPEALPDPGNVDKVLGTVFHSPESRRSKDSGISDSDVSTDGLMQEVASIMMDSMRDTYAMLARRMELFRGVEPEHVAKLFSQGITREFAAGEIIFSKGDDTHEVFVILNGSVEIANEGKVLATLDRGDMFGEMALVSDDPRSADARALSNTSVLMLQLNTIQTLVRPKVAIQILMNIIATLSQRLRAANLD
ncbi:MAG: cyclic nucleotide-binding domain-containing protein [Candidatus Hydrogenedentes bacterium]|nr:cyclic nucleotide-binding domain-containing protein [Candidatus Hydrogenedentota bacterium]